MAKHVKKETKWGVVHRLEDGCKDDWDNLRTYDQGERSALSIITLQGPALRSLKDAEIALFRRMHPLKARRRKRKNQEPGRENIVVLAGSKRTCELQEAKWKEDPQRFAPPWVGLHTQGLAIDVSQAQRSRKLRLTYQVLAAHGWTRTRPDDEPWHWSFGWTA